MMVRVAAAAARVAVAVAPEVVAAAPLEGFGRPREHQQDVCGGNAKGCRPLLSHCVGKSHTCAGQLWTRAHLPLWSEMDRSKQARERWKPVAVSPLSGLPLDA